MKKLISAIKALIIISGMGITAHAAERLDRQYIESEIWSEVWQGKDDNGTVFPEASYKHYLLDKWLDDNYGSDDYDWNSIGELKYNYKRYYQSLIEDWIFNDDENGNWTIITEDNTYSFKLSGSQWSMLDKNGDTVLMFPVYSTLNEDKHVNNSVGGANSNRVIGNVIIGTETPTDSPEYVTEGNSEGESKGGVMPFIIVGIGAVVIGATAIVLRKRKR